MKITDEQLQHWFTYHSPTPDQLPKYQRIRDAGHQLAMTIVEDAPEGADVSAAVRLIREACMTANAAIACEGK